MEDSVVPVLHGWEFVPRLERFIVVIADIHANTNLELMKELLEFFIDSGMPAHLVSKICKESAQGVMPDIDLTKKDKLLSICVELWYYNWYPDMRWSMLSQDDWHAKVVALLKLYKLRGIGQRLMPSTNDARTISSSCTNVTLLCDIHCS